MENLFSVYWDTMTSRKGILPSLLLSEVNFDEEFASKQRRSSSTLLGESVLMKVSLT